MALIIKLALLIGGFAVGFLLLRRRQHLQGKISILVFSWLLPYIVFIEVASMKLEEYWYLYSLVGAAFLLLPFFLGQWGLGLSKHKAALLATAEGGSIGFVIYATLGIAPLQQFFLVDMIGNGLAVFFIVFPLLVEKKEPGWRTGFNRLAFIMIAGLLASILEFRPLSLSPESALGLVGILQRIEPWLISLLVILISAIVGAGVRLNISREIFSSRFFGGFWVYRLFAIVVSLWQAWPLALTVLFTLPPSFLLPVLYSSQKANEERVIYADNFIAACLPITIMLIVGLFIVLL